MKTWNLISYGILCAKVNVFFLSDVDLCGFQIRLGTSLQYVLGNKKTTAEDIKILANFYHSKKYLIITDLRSKQIFVSLQQGESALDVIQAYFHAVMLGIAICTAHKIPLVSILK